MIMVKAEFSVFAVCFLLFFCSCVGSNKEQLQNISAEQTLGVADTLIIDLEHSIGASSADTMVLNSIADSVRFVPLEINEHCLVADYYNKLAATSDSYFVSGGAFEDNNGVLQFDHAGKFVQNIVKIGRGPGELPNVLVWSINASLRRICASGMSESLLIRSWDTDESMGFPIQGESDFYFVSLDDGSFVSTIRSGIVKDGADVSYLNFCDSLGFVQRTIKYAQKRDVFYVAIPGKLQHPFENYLLSASYRGGALFGDVYNDTIYYIKDRDHISPHVVFTRGKLIPQIKDVYDDVRKAEQIYFRDATETARYFLLKYFYRGQLYTGIWDKQTLKLVSRAGRPTEAALSEKFHARYVLPDGEQVLVKILYADKDRLYGLLDASVAARFMDGVDEEDNPVVMIVHLKP